MPNLRFPIDSRVWLRQPQLSLLPSRPLGSAWVEGGRDGTCQACGADVLHFGWVNMDGVGVLLHDGVDDSVPCPVAVPFNWETGKPLPAGVLAVAA